MTSAWLISAALVAASCGPPKALEPGLTVVLNTQLTRGPVTPTFEVFNATAGLELTLTVSGALPQTIPPDASGPALFDVTLRAVPTTVIASQPGSGVSNRVVVQSNGQFVTEAPTVPDLVVLAGSSTSSVLVLTTEPASVRLTDVEGRELASGMYQCQRPPAGLEAAGVECTVNRQQPLQTDGYPGSSVRAISSSSAGLVLTRAVRLP